jgi:anti-sigma factor (TIGR02949 family)
MSAMDCTHIRSLVSPYIDGELAAEKAAEVERHLESCEACRALVEDERRVSAAVRHHGERFRAPAHLKARVLSEVGRRSRGSGWSDLRMLGTGWNPVALAASLVLAVMLSSGATVAYLSRSAEESKAPLVQEVVSGQIRSLMADHLTDVASSDQHTVKPWFAGKSDLAPPAVDLANEGFPLVGGRLDVIAGKPIPALVYRRREHVINVFVLAASRGDLGSTLSRHGYSLRHWNEGDLGFWAASDAAPSELVEFERIFRAATSG